MPWFAGLRSKPRSCKYVWLQLHLIIYDRGFHWFCFLNFACDFCNPAIHQSFACDVISTPIHLPYACHPPKFNLPRLAWAHPLQRTARVWSAWLACTDLCVTSSCVTEALPSGGRCWCSRSLWGASGLPKLLQVPWCSWVSKWPPKWGAMVRGWPWMGLYNHARPLRWGFDSLRPNLAQVHSHSELGAPGHPGAFASQPHHAWAPRVEAGKLLEGSGPPASELVRAGRREAGWTWDLVQAWSVGTKDDHAYTQSLPKFSFKCWQLVLVVFDILPAVCVLGYEVGTSSIGEWRFLWSALFFNAVMSDWCSAEHRHGQQFSARNCWAKGTGWPNFFLWAVNYGAFHCFPHFRSPSAISLRQLIFWVPCSVSH